MKAKSAVCSARGRGHRSGAVPEQVVGVAFVVGIDGDQAGLGAGGALIEGEVGGGALGDRVRVAENPLGGVEDHVLGGLGFAGILQ